MTQQTTATTTTWSYRIERTGADPERSCLAYGNRDLGPEWSARTLAEVVALENRYAHLYYREGLTVTVWQRGKNDERRPRRTGPCPADAEVFTFGPVPPDAAYGSDLDRDQVTATRRELPETPLTAFRVAAQEDRRRDALETVAEGVHALTSASWYPPVAGDVITIHFEANATIEAFTECYTVIEVNDGTPRKHELLFAGCNPDTAEVRELSGYFAGPGFADPMTAVWMEAGQQRLTIERGGKLVHDGPGSLR